MDIFPYKVVNVRAFLRGMCPNCEGLITDERLVNRLPCRKCLQDSQIGELCYRDKSVEDYYQWLIQVEKLLKKNNTLKAYKNIVELEREVEMYNRFFKKIIGNNLWSAQRAWAKRVLQNKSFTILAPTGIGKTVFGSTIALYLATKNKKSYIVLPTTLLAKQVYEKILNFSSNVDVNARIVAYFSGMNSKEKKETLKKIASGNFDILITTSHFLTRRFDILKDKKFDFIFVDDVDSILKSSKSIDKLLYLLGYPSEVINLAMENITLKIKTSYFLRTKKKIPEDLHKNIEENSRKLNKFLSNLKPGCIVISTATGKPRGLRIRLFRELMGFDIGARAEILRNVIDTYKFTEENKLVNDAVELVRKLGKGGLIFVPPGTKDDFIEAIVEMLNKYGIKASYVHSKDKKGLEDFIDGKVDVLVGIATYYGLLVRGLDLPHLIKYTIFLGIPHFKFTAEVEELSPTRLVQIALNIRELLSNKEQAKLDRLVSSIRRYLTLLDKSKFLLLMQAMKENKELTGPLGKIQSNIIQVRELLKRYFSDESFIRKIEERTIFSIRKIGEKTYFLLPDAMTYLQASGRTSRMYAGGISKGLSIVLTLDKKLFEGLVKQTKWYSEEITWVELSELNLEEILVEITKEREFIRRIIGGKIKPEEMKDLVKTALLIVESPTKARTIASFFGKPSRRKYEGLTIYETSIGNYILLVTASKGHILDLVTNEGYYGVKVEQGRKFFPIYTTIKRCQNCGEQFTDYPNDDKAVCPKCSSDKIIDQYDVIDKLREISREVDIVLIGTDPDTEGEKIAWDLKNVLSPYVPTLKRIEFHEVTKYAIEKAINNPRDINLNLVDAQIVRRIEDRWIGFVLSKKLWNKFGKRWLSAGRVQTPVLGWIIGRFEDARRSIKTIFRITLENNKVFVVDTVNLNSKNPKEIAREILEKGVEISIISDQITEANPPPPFTTDTLLREASARFKIDTTTVMQIAQDLFELGLITYHRTDSTRVSTSGLAVAKQYIAEKLGEKYYNPRIWRKEGAHECIRPTRPLDLETLQALIRQGVLQLVRPLNKLHFLLYDLIFRRFIASQMPEAKIIRTRFKLTGPNFEKEYDIISNVVEHGFTLIYPIPLEEKPKEGSYRVIDVKHRKLPTVPLYAQADIIQLMKEKGIGRPSTYAKIIRTLLERHYVKETKRKKLIPTKLGINVFNYLSSNFPSLVSEDRTRIVEEIMDKIELGEINHLHALEDFYEEIRNVEEKE